MQTDRQVAVLTGDLIASTKAPKERVDYTMRLLAGELPPGIRWEGWSAEDFRFTRFRGDGWQMLCPQKEYALRWAVVLLASLRSDPMALGTRISIGIGEAASLGTEDLRDASGSAFEESGRRLDAMYRGEKLFIMGGETLSRRSREEHNDLQILGAEKAAVIMIDERISRWTPEQAEAAAHFLHPSKPAATEIAIRLGITPQAVGYRLKGAGAKALRESLEALELDWTHRWELSA